MMEVKPLSNKQLIDDFNYMFYQLYRNIFLIVHFLSNKLNDNSQWQSDIFQINSHTSIIFSFIYACT